MAAAASGFQPADRLRHRKEFLRVYQEGRRVGGRCFSLFYHRGCTDRHRLGITVPKQVGNAVIRNRVKRRMREIFRLNRDLLGEVPLDLVVNVYGPGGAADSEVLKAEFSRMAREALGGKGRPGRKLAPRGRRGAAARKPAVAVHSRGGTSPSEGSRQ